jgi:phosphohistidine swiveling domain-containing protein
MPGRFIGAEYIDTACNLFVLKQPNDLAVEKHFQMLFTKPATYDKLHQRVVQYADAIFRDGRRYRRLIARRLTDRELVRQIDRFQEQQALVHVPRGVVWLLETPENVVSRYLYHYLEERQRDAGTVSEPPQQAFQTLATPLQPSLWTKEREDLIRIAQKKDKRKSDRQLDLHTTKYEWLEYGLQGKLLDRSYFAERLAKLRLQLKSGHVRTFAQERKEVSARQHRLVREYRIGRSHAKIFQIIRDSLWSRLYSKDSQFYGYYCMDSLLREFGRRTGLTLEQVRYLAPDDYATALIKRMDFRKITNERMKYSLLFCDKGKSVFYHGVEARKIRKRMKFFKPKVKQGSAEALKGQPAFSGQASGRVKIINTRQEMVKMHQGNVLVSHMTNPDIVPAMKQAVAIVTDLGGITCHAAIVARELKVPCVIGTKVATKVLRDGDIVEVDAERGIVRKI